MEKGFDFIIANPPFKNHIKFLDKCVDSSNENGRILFVHPSSQFIDVESRVHYYKNLNDKIGNNLYSINLFNGNGLFGIELFVPLSITYIDKNKKDTNIIIEDEINGTSYTCSDVSFITPYGKSDFFYQIKEKIKDLCGLHGSILEIGTCLSSRQEDRKKLKNPESYFVETSDFKGDIVKNNKTKKSEIYNPPFHSLIIKSTCIKNGTNPKYPIWFEFETFVEAQNFMKYAKSDFVRFCLMTTKFNQRIQKLDISSIPKVDFCEEWTNEKIYSFFNLSNDEISYIKSKVKPHTWDGTRKEKTKKPK